MNTFELDKKFIAPTYARFPLEIVGGKGSVLLGGDGREYIDLGSGIAVNIFGAVDDEWVKACTEQMNRFQHTSNLFYSEPCAKLAQMLCERTGMNNVFFSNSGAEANECAIKAARRWGALNKGEEYTTIITLKNSFHGRTLTTLAATGQDAFHKDFLPLTEGFVYAEPNDIDDVKRLCKENKCAAVMFEIVQGEGGVNALSKEFVSGLVKLAKEENLLLVCDEVQIGNGRSGMLYGFMNYGFKPDIFSTAKGLGGGLPLGATVLGEKVKDVFAPGLNGSTFGGNPVCCAGAISILSRLDEKLLAEVREKSEYIFSTLRGSSGIKSVSGLGLMIGVETEKDSNEVLAKCRENGVLVLKAKTKIRLLPPLNIPFDTLKKAIDVLKDACRI